MNYKIWKYVLTPDQAPVAIPAGTRLLKIMGQGDDVCLWALVPDGDAERGPQLLKYQIKITGAMVTETDQEHYEYYDSVDLHNGAVILHVFLHRSSHHHFFRGL